MEDRRRMRHGHGDGNATVVIQGGAVMQSGADEHGGSPGQEEVSRREGKRWQQRRQTPLCNLAELCCWTEGTVAILLVW